MTETDVQDGALILLLLFCFCTNFYTCMQSMYRQYFVKIEIKLCQKDVAAVYVNILVQTFFGNGC